ncbi:MAG: SsrA-binding protein SmpB [Metamycoplasmataceae bacterium]
MKLIAKNKKAFYDYQILDTYNAGISLMGWEVKSIRAGRINLANSFCYFKSNELFASNMHISLWMGIRDIETKPRKLLLKKSELKKIKHKKDTEKVTIIPLEVYFDRSYIKLKIGIAKGRKKYDKRQYIMARDEKKVSRYKK